MSEPFYFTLLKTATASLESTSYKLIWVGKHSKSAEMWTNLYSTLESRDGIGSFKLLGCKSNVRLNEIKKEQKRYTTESITSWCNSPVLSDLYKAQLSKVTYQ